MLARPEGIEAGILGQPGDMGGGLWRAARASVEIEEADVHGVAPSLQ
jgi:hypothetical protein